MSPPAPSSPGLVAARRAGAVLLALLPGAAPAEPLDLTLPFTRREATRQGDWCVLRGVPAPREGGAIALAREDSGRMQLGLLLPRGVAAPAAGGTVPLSLRLGPQRLRLPAQVREDGWLLAEVPAEHGAALTPPGRVLALSLGLREGAVRYRLDEDAAADAGFRACIAAPPSPPPPPEPDPVLQRVVAEWRVDVSLGCSLMVRGGEARATVSIVSLAEARQVAMLQLHARPSALRDDRSYDAVFSGVAGGFRLSGVARDGALALFLKRGGQDDPAMAREFAAGGTLELRDTGRTVELWQIEPAPEASRAGLERCVVAQAPL